MGILFIVQTYTGFSMAWATPDTIATIIGLVTPVLVWAIPRQEGRLSMSWQEGIAVAVVLLGLGAGAFLVAQRPSFWIEFGTRLIKALLPSAAKYIAKRMPPEEEAAWHAAERRGQGDEWLKARKPFRHGSCER